jgi:hypothetical protein
MPSLVNVKVKGHTYVYESTSYREGGKAKNRRRTVGKVDPDTGERHFYADYIEEMRAVGTPVDVPASQPAYSAGDVRGSAILEAGLTHLLSEAAEGLGLLPALRDAAPRHWAELFAMACHLVANNEAMMHVEEWAASSDMLPVGDLGSRRISELLAAVDAGQRARFYELWCEARSDAELLAMDITSASSYSELIDDVEWGHNRDGEALPQVNVCMLVGVTSRLPVYQVVYAGSIRDVSTLDATMDSMREITGGRPVTTVADKGFYSKRNMLALLDGPTERRFIASVPFTAGFANALVASESKDIDRPEKTIVLGGSSMRAVSKERAFYGRGDVHAHVFYNAVKAAQKREDILAGVAVLRDEALAGPEAASTSAAHKKFLNIRRSKAAESGWTVSIKDGAVEAAVGNAGWLVLISNCVADAKEAISIYRAKDVVEKGFEHLKDDLDLGRLRVHGQERMQSKVFVGFIALVLMSHIHKVMLDNGLYKRMTLRQLTRQLRKHRVQVIRGERVMYPPSKTQKEIYAAFGVEPPV